MKNGPCTTFNVPVNKNRKFTKRERGFGILAMGEVSEKSWCQQHDPLFHVKGLERNFMKKMLNK